MVNHPAAVVVPVVHLKRLQKAVAAHVVAQAPEVQQAVAGLMPAAINLLQLDGAVRQEQAVVTMLNPRGQPMAAV